MKAMGDAYTHLLPTATRCCSRCRATPPAPTRRSTTHVRERFATLVRQVQEADRRPAGRPVVASSRTGCCSTSIAAVDLEALASGRSGPPAGVDAGHASRSPGGLMLDRARRVSSTAAAARVLGLAGGRARRAGFFGGPVFGLLDSDDDFDDPRPRRRSRRATSSAPPGVSAAPDLVALVRLGAPADCAAGPAQARPRRGARCAIPGVRLVRYEPGGDRALVSKDGRSTYLAAYVPDERRDGVLDTRRGPTLEAMPGVTIGGDEIARDQVGEQVSEDLARAELLAFPILFLLSLFVFRSVVAALLPLRGRRRDDPALVPARCGSSTRVRADVDLRAQPHHRARAGARDRLLAVHRLALPRGARARAATRGAALRATMSTAGRTVLFSLASRWPRRSPRCSCSRCASCTRWASAG